MKSEENASRLLWLAEGNARQARKRVAAKVIVQNQVGHVLLVNPTYKEHWDIPGGMAEENESPRAAAEREVVEELGLRVNIGSLLGIDWVGPHGPWDDQVIFIFDGGSLSGNMAEKLAITDNEISEFRFFPKSDAFQLLRTDVAERLARAIDSLGTDRTHYTEHPIIDHSD